MGVVWMLNRETHFEIYPTGERIELKEVISYGSPVFVRNSDYEEFRSEVNRDLNVDAFTIGFPDQSEDRRFPIQRYKFVK